MTASVLSVRRARREGEAGADHAGVRQGGRTRLRAARPGRIFAPPSQARANLGWSCLCLCCANRNSPLAGRTGRPLSPIAELADGRTCASLNAMVGHAASLVAVDTRAKTHQASPRHGPNSVSSLGYGVLACLSHGYGEPRPEPFPEAVLVRHHLTVDSKTLDSTYAVSEKMAFGSIRKWRLAPVRLHRALRRCGIAPFRRSMVRHNVRPWICLRS